MVICINQFVSKKSEQSEQSSEFDLNSSNVGYFQALSKIKKRGQNVLYETPHKIKRTLKYRCECQIQVKINSFFAIGTRLSLHKAL